MLVRLLYASRAVAAHGRPDAELLGSILRQSQANNPKCGVTGLLCFSGGVFLQVLDPAAFGGADAFARETGWLADAARSTPPAPGRDAVRLPGERGLQLRARQMREGVRLYPGIMPALAAWADRLGVPPPAPHDGAAEP